MENKEIAVVKKNFITRFLNKIKYRFSKNKKIYNDNIDLEISNDNFKDDLIASTNLKEIELKKDYENGKIDLKKLESEKLDELILIYKNEIKQKEEKLDNLRLNIIKFKNSVT